jgi:hypothetical protein
MIDSARCLLRLADDTRSKEITSGGREDAEVGRSRRDHWAGDQAPVFLSVVARGHFRIELRMDETEVIHLRLGRLEDMFRTSESHVLSPHSRFEPGIDYCISELRSRRSRLPVRLELELPSPQLDSEARTRLRQTLHRYCEDRIGRNDRERRIARRDAYAALKLGVPVAIVGLAIAVATAVARAQEDYTLPNLAGWVLAWVGLWYPLDALLFSSVAPKRENAVLSRLQDAEVVLQPL